MNITHFLNEIINRNRLQEEIDNLQIMINKAKAGETRGIDESINTMQKTVEKYKKQLKKYNEIVSSLIPHIANFNDLNNKYVVAEKFNTDITNNPLCNDNKIKKSEYSDLIKLRDVRRKEANIIQQIIENNIGVIITKDGDTIGNFLEKYGLEENEISNNLQEQTEEQANRKIFSLGVDIEKRKDIEKMSDTVLNGQYDKNNNNIQLPKVFHDPEVNNEKTQNIFHYCYKSLEKLLYLHEQEKTNLKEEQYNIIVNYYMNIIELYQQIQLTIQTKETYKNSTANKYNDSLDKIIQDAHNEIEKLYNDLNKYVGKVDKDNIMGMLAENKVNKQDNKEKGNEFQFEYEPKISNKGDDISNLDNFRQEIIGINQNQELIDRRNILMGKYNEFRNLKNGHANITFENFLKVYYPNEKELIKAEEVREKQIRYVYDLWQKSGRTMDFGHYAETVQGVKVDHPEDYIKESDTINYDTPIKSTVSYVETKERSIEDARERYRKKNALWRFFNKKKSIDRLNVENMTVEEINQLYGGKEEEVNGRTR